MDAHHTRPDPTRPGPTPAEADLFERHGLGPERLLDTLAEVPPCTIAGLEPTEESLAIHLAPIPDDPRGTLAGLFEFVAPPSWQAVAVCVEGRADATDEDDSCDDDGDVDIRALLMRSGVLCTRVDGVDGTEELPATISHPSGTGGSPAAHDAPSGLLVDCLHRMLGLRTPGPAPDPVDVALGTWAQAMLECLFERGDLSWADAVRLHPGAPGGAARSPAPVAPSVETLVEATFRSTDDWDWARVHRRARHGSVRAALTPGEASWMDTAMYGRWVVSHLADPLGVAELLDSYDFEEVAAGLRAVVDGVERWRDPADAA